MEFNIADMIEAVSDHVPDREALVCGEKRVSYRDLDRRATKLAHYLQTKGVSNGDNVGLYMYNCIEYLEAVLACFKIRAVPININYRYIDEELRYIFDNADLVACIYHRQFTPYIRDISDTFVRSLAFVSVDDGSDEPIECIEADEFECALGAQSDTRDFSPRSENDLFILYTGGTTGNPKGVIWTHRNLFFAALGGGGHFSAQGICRSPEDIISRIAPQPVNGIALAPLMHGASWWYACIQLLAGNKLVLNHHRSLVGDQVWDICEREKINALQIVGDAMAIPLIDALDQNPGRWKLDSIFSMSSGGAVFSRSKQDAFRKYFPGIRIINSFGSSESGQMGADNGSQKGISSLGNVQRSEFMDVIVVEEDAGVLRHAQPGEHGIFARSGFIPIGYYNDPEKTEKTFVDVEGRRWLLTGDAAQIEGDGSITLFGRGSNCINSGGEKIFPEEVENVLKSHDSVFDALVVGVKDERWGSKVVAVIQPRDGVSVGLDDIQRHCRQYLAGYKVPRSIVVTERLPRSPSGKPDYASAKAIAESS
ncbi:acyl-CoA synthetase [Parahaliea mediterranea]|uniref:Acyl-CoA synthetase n=2 Tax=Parahaliea mediterranea TaxID=651086 RepID=A0A939IK28_9GAMM|nr:acyl-CoA synthetase [Parahaliea mediterranea]